ncbi:MAG: GAF domain-containing protein [Verrucomicrobia bacterium]|nr:GAF domain-containing protein [Verrucomicrobiota bacterium]
MEKRVETQDEIETLKAQAGKLDETVARDNRGERETPDHWQYIAQSIPNIIVNADCEGRILYINRVSGRKNPEGLIGTSVYDIVPTDYMDVAMECFKNVCSTGVSQSFEARSNREDGTCRWWKQDVTAIRSPSGEIDGISIVATDVTERKEAEEAVRRDAEERRALAEIGRVIGSSLDIDEVYERFAEQVRTLVPADRIIIGLIDQTEQTLAHPYIWGTDVPQRRRDDVVPLEGTQGGEVLKLGTGLLIHSQDRHEIAQSMPGLLPLFDSGFRSFLSIPLISKDEIIGVLHLRSLSPNAYTQRDLEMAESVGAQIAGAVANSMLYADLQREVEERTVLGEIGRIINSSLDIDEVYQQFAQQTHKLIEFDITSISLINGSNGFIVAYTSELIVPSRQLGEIIPLEGSGTGFTLERNQVTVINMDDEKTLSSRIPGLVPPYLAGIRTFMGVPLSHRGEAIGALLFTSTHRNAFDERDAQLAELVSAQIAGTIANSKLYAERKLVEEQMLQMQKMEAVGQLAGGIAHDFNNMLTSIIGYTQLALMKVSPDDGIINNLQEIERGAERATDLTRQLMVFSRRQVTDPKVVNLNDVVTNIDSMLRRIVDEDIELVILLASDLGLIKIDPRQFEQVLINLVINARDAMQGGGKLYIETTNVILDEGYVKQHHEVTEGEFIRLAIKDTGIGMTEEAKAQAFDPFFTTKEVGKGTGLGLSICYGIVTQNRGHITIDTGLGEGTTVTVYLPRVEELAAHLPTQDPSIPVRGSLETVLIVEDEESVRGVTANILREFGYRVLEAANGHEALRTAKEHSDDVIHLMLTDVVMPKMGGRELADRMRLLYPETKVLYTSGYPDDAVLHRDVLAAGVDFIQKPFTPLGLARQLRKILDRDK